MITLICRKTCSTCQKAVKLLDDKKLAYTYREYTKEPLSKAEIKDVLSMLGLKAQDVLRKHDKAFKELGLSGDESEAKLVSLMAEHPTLLQRPIGIKGKKAVVGRPVETLLDL